MASAMPVLPEVASIRVSPGLIAPRASASLIMLNAGLCNHVRVQVTDIGSAELEV